MSTIVLHGDDVFAARFFAIVSAMKFELESGLFTGKSPFRVAVSMLGLDGKFDDEGRCINKSDVYSQACNIDVDDAINRIKSFKHTKNTPRVGTGTLDKSFSVAGGFFTVTQRQIINLLCCAFEGGSNYWYMISKFNEPSDPAMVPEEFAEFSHLSCCWGDGSIEICDKEEFYENNESSNGIDKFILNEASIESGLNLFANNHKKMFVSFIIDDEYDSDSADLFLQYCLFGKIVFG